MILYSEFSMPKRKNQQQRKAAKREEKKEVTAVGKILRAVGGLGGGALGNMIGQGTAGNQLGTSLGAAISRWVGAGDYEVQSNSIVQRTLRGSAAIPMMHKDGQSITVRHKEYLGEIRGNTSFTVQQTYSLNPGNSYTFPWLSTIAAKFQEYTFKGVVFHYVPTSGSAINSTNPALGSVMLQTSYRPGDSAPASKVEMLNEYWSMESSPIDTAAHPIECAVKENLLGTRYVRTGAVPAGDNIALYDVGTTFVATSGQPASGNVVGDLWVTYEVELRKPVMNSPVNSVVSSAAYQCLTPSPGNYFTGTTATITGNIPIAASARTITFPVGTTGVFEIMVLVTASTTFTAIDLSGTPTLTNCAQVYLDPLQMRSYARTVLGGTSPTVGNGFYVTKINITDPQQSATVQLPSGSWTGASSDCLLTITECSSTSG